MGAVRHVDLILNFTVAPDGTLAVLGNPSAVSGDGVPNGPLGLPTRTSANGAADSDAFAMVLHRTISERYRSPIGFDTREMTYGWSPWTRYGPVAARLDSLSTSLYSLGDTARSERAADIRKRLIWMIAGLAYVDWRAERHMSSRLGEIGPADINLATPEDAGDAADALYKMLVTTIFNFGEDHKLWYHQR